MNIKNKISVIIPLFNASAFMSRAIHSVINQSYKDIEIILIDDGSNDNTYEKAKVFEYNDERIKVFHQKNAGPGVARNLGLSKATGEFICFLDADDQLKENALETMLISMDKEIDIVQCRSQKIYNSNKKDCDIWNDKIIIMSPYQAMNNYLYDSSPVIRFAVWAKLLRKEKIENIQFPNINLCEDVVFTANAIAASRKVKYIPDLLHYSYISETSLTHSINYKKRVYDHIIANRLIFELIEKEKQFKLLRKRTIWNLISSYIYGSIELINNLKNKESKYEINKLREYCRKENIPLFHTDIKSIIIKYLYIISPKITVYLFQKVMEFK